MNRASDFPHDLRRAMRAAGYVKADGTVNVYRFARVLDPTHPERAERKLRRWLSPTSRSLPSRRSLEQLAAALDVPVEMLRWEGGPR